MKINYNAPFWRLVRKYQGHILLILFLILLSFTTSFALIKSMEFEEQYQNRIWNEHKLVWEVRIRD